VIRAWWAEFRHGAPLAAGLLTLLAGVALGATVGRQPMLPGCADPLNAGLVLGVTVSPLALGAAAVHVARLQNGRLLALAGTSPRGRGGTLRLAWAAIAAWQLLGYAGAQLFILGNTSLHGYCSPAMLVLPAAGMGFSILMSGIGVLLGAIRPHWATGAIAGAMALFVVLGIQRLEGPAGRLVPTFIFTYYQPFLDPNVALNLAHLAFYLAAGAMIWALLPMRRGAGLAVVAAAAAVLGSGVLAHVVDGDPVQHRRPELRRCLSADGVQLCVWPESEAALHPGLVAIQRSKAVVGDRLPTPSTFQQEGLTGPAGSSTLRFDAREITTAELQHAAHRAMVPQPACQAGLEAWFSLLDWIVAGSEPGYAAPEALAIRSLPDGQQRTWLAARYTAATTACR